MTDNLVLRDGDVDAAVYDEAARGRKDACSEFAKGNFANGGGIVTAKTKPNLNGYRALSERCGSSQASQNSGGEGGGIHYVCEGARVDQGLLCLE